MQKIIDYQLITSSSPHTLNVAVRDAMNEDWVPSGNVIAQTDKLIQTMVKFEPEFMLQEPADDLVLPIS